MALIGKCNGQPIYAHNNKTSILNIEIWHLH